MQYTDTRRAMPENGSIVKIKTQKFSCGCGGSQYSECYFDDGKFKGIKNQRLVVSWQYSPANDLIKDLEQRKCIVATGCKNCEPVNA